MLAGAIRAATGAKTVVKGGKFVKVKAYTRTVGGKEIKVRAFERRTPPAHHSSGCTGKLSDALKTPLQSAAVALGWHVILDGNVWCAVGPIFEDLLISPAGWGSTPEEAREALTRRHQREDSALVPQLPAFRIWG
jgi:hypothetical protein